MKSARVSFKNKNVLIIGGGKIALKKGLSFLNEGANIRFLAPVFCEEILQYEHHCEIYDSSFLNDVFLVYACTDDRILNHQVIMDANEKGILCANCQFDEDASYIPLESRMYPDFHVAVSTNGAYPMYNKILLDDIEVLYMKKHEEILKVLREVRQKLLLEDMDSKTRHKMLKDELLCKTIK